MSDRSCVELQLPFDLDQGRDVRGARSEKRLHRSSAAPNESLLYEFICTGAAQP